MITKTTVGASPTIVSAAKVRRWAIVQNQSDSATVWVSWESDAANVTITSGAKPGIKLTAGQTVALNEYSTQGGAGNQRILRQINDLNIYAISSAAGAIVVVHEE